MLNALISTVKLQVTDCHKKIKSVISSKPVEECDVQPIKHCKHVTKLVPALKSVDECVDVPSEVCAMSKVNPKKKNRPTIQKWCYKPEDQPTETPTEDITETPNEAPTDTTTEPPTETPTEPPTEAPTEAPTEPSTETPTEPPTPECDEVNKCEAGNICEDGKCIEGITQSSNQLLWLDLGI